MHFERRSSNQLLKQKTAILGRPTTTPHSKNRNKKKHEGHGSEKTIATSELGEGNETKRASAKNETKRASAKTLPYLLQYTHR